MATPFHRTTRSLAADSGRGALWAWALALLLGGAWLAWFGLGRVTLWEVTPHARLEVQQAAHPVSAQQAGALRSTALQLGRSVKAGEVLAELDDRAARARLAEEAARLAAIPARRAALRAEIATLASGQDGARRSGEAAAQAATARAAELLAQIEFAREHERRLAAEAAAGGVAEIEALRSRSETRRLLAAAESQAAEARRLAAEVQVRDAQSRSRLDALQGQLAALDGEAATLSASVARLQTEGERLFVRAPVDGTLAEVMPLSPGGWVAEGQRMATVLPAGGLRVVADFAPASALGRVRPGQPARVRLDGFPWVEHGTLGARVQQVAGEVHEQRLRVELRLDPQPAAGALPLRHGLTGSVEVALDEVSPAVLLLRSLGRWTAPPPAAAPATTVAAGLR